LNVQVRETTNHPQTYLFGRYQPLPFTAGATQDPGSNAQSIQPPFEFQPLSSQAYRDAYYSQEAQPRDHIFGGNALMDESFITDPGTPDVESQRQNNTTDNVLTRNPGSQAAAPQNNTIADTMIDPALLDHAQVVQSEQDAGESILICLFYDLICITSSCQ
jgi:hypothetical protein